MVYKIGYIMRLPKPHKLSKKALIIGSVILLLVVGGLGWWLTTTRATSDYRAQLTGVVSTIQDDLKQSNQQFSELAKEKNNVKALVALKLLEEKLKEKAGALPPLPKLLGLTLTPNEDEQKRRQITQHMLACANDLAPLQGLTLKTGANAEQQKELAESWQSVITRLKNTEQPAVAADVHQQIITVTTSIQSKLAALPDLYTKKDIAGFAAKQKEIETHVNELRSLGGAIAALSVEQDKRIQDGYIDLGQLLK